MKLNLVNLLELVEAYAELHGLRFDSEESVSEAFDEEIAPLVIEEYGEDDKDAMNQAFNDWTDSLCEDGYLHLEQYEKYSYVGKYSNESE